MIRIRANNGRTTTTKVVDECDSTTGCDEEHAFQSPCKNNIVDGSIAVWRALGLNTDLGIVPITWSMPNQLEPLKVLMEIGWDHEVFNVKDTDGHTILHLAVTGKQIEIRASEPSKYTSHNDSKKRSLKILQKDDWLGRKKNTLMIVATLIATTAFQVGLNPPNGVWHDNSKDI
ncbi:hypothetical protein RND71_025332 [Anisodus tanguticus]|uniref:PGG domain-containing protein n=1 Tax=Anisodus tanguticus TaxID=243964 RepID=A0AAE1RSR9_9SOLA|nr:hypothetical protein RND71_025332 [Anisodus tanguticus]